MPADEMTPQPSDDQPPRLARLLARELNRDRMLGPSYRGHAERHLGARDTCPTCGGSGEGPIASEHDCEDCGGAGTIPRTMDQLGYELKTWLQELAPEHVSARVHQALMTVALEAIDWDALATECVRDELTHDG